MTGDATHENPPAENSVPDLWETARYFFRWLVSICGDPCALVAGSWLSRKERREIAFWLRPVEAIVRRLLVAEAARIANAPPPQKARPAAGNAPAAKGGLPVRAPFCRVDFPDPENSTCWRVRFSFAEPEARAASPASGAGPRIRVLDTDAPANVLACAALARAVAQHRARFAKLPGDAPCSEAPALRPKSSRGAGIPWRLARRIEALARVLENPAPYARRLALRLRKDAARLARLCRPPPPRKPGERPAYGHTALRHASDHALQALAPFDTG